MALLKTDNTLVHKLATFLYRSADDRTRIRALLCHVYFLAIHNRYSEARDMLLMSHIQDSINDADVDTRILFNRTMAQLGLCAFRVNETRQALFCLADLYQSNRIKELLAQGVTTHRYYDRDIDKEKEEKGRQYPYHMHISLEMLEAVHLMSAMFVEVPNFAIHGVDNKRRIMSKNFRRLFEHHQRQPFNGPPENTRDLVMAATKALRVGEWQKCLKYIMRLRMWDSMPNAEFVKTAIKQKIQEESLRTYLLTYAPQYGSISLKTLMEMFEMDSRIVYRVTSKMMVNEQLQGAWDQPTESIVLHAQEPTRLQKAALKYADKIGVFVEQNERLLEQRGFFGKSDKKWNDYGNNSSGMGSSSGGSSSGGLSYAAASSGGKGGAPSYSSILGGQSRSGGVNGIRSRAPVSNYWAHTQAPPKEEVDDGD